MIIGKDTKQFLNENLEFQHFWKIVKRAFSSKVEWCLFLIQEDGLNLLTLGMTPSSVKIANKIAQLVVDKCPREDSKFFVTFPVESEEIQRLLQDDSMENRIKLVRGDNAEL